jgi:hypothetical protein
MRGVFKTRNINLHFVGCLKYSRKRKQEIWGGFLAFNFKAFDGHGGGMVVDLCHVELRIRR